MFRIGEFSRLAQVSGTTVTPTLDLAVYQRRNGFPEIRTPRFTGESPEWEEAHGRRAETSAGTPIPAGA